MTVRITTTQPWASLPTLFNGQVGYIAAPKQVDDFHGGDHPIGTGPFMFKEWAKNDHFTATRNPEPGLLA
jgi:peptide/nickel transport system substrate-binding protein